MAILRIELGLLQQYVLLASSTSICLSYHFYQFSHMIQHFPRVQFHNVQIVMLLIVSLLVGVVLLKVTTSEKCIYHMYRTSAIRSPGFLFCFFIFKGHFYLVKFGYYSRFGYYSTQGTICGVTVFRISGFIIFDTQMIMTRVSPEEYIIATIELYLDIINLFIEILKILDKINRKQKKNPYSYDEI